ncbi:A/G-specific adenine DNA glycosylase-like protein [Perkinsela sp. CCAP 1560/4]|nr:A/G-specific adenine DNA glycosylase-like protein [Perkinsela sp. CCAP 1560/4]|eukprot:KNH05901.1 A/G-specific adenine DNA glycosylase-like protein [Perkinsela sp. CCAP 1560/4]
MTIPDIEDVDGFRHQLMTWYDKQKRDLPWRQPGVSPYGIWVSEVMLQQTQVVRVIEYWNKWMKRFPDVQTLAKANVDDVFSHWSGLGYYRRATGLHKGAQYILDHHDGKLPRDMPSLLKIPSIGPYIAAAIASSAYDVPCAAVDANIMRVYARIYALEKFDLNQGESRRKIQAIADKAFDTTRCVDWNQAIMDLGALICKPREVKCDICPIRKFCGAYRSLKAQNGDEPISEKLTRLYPLSRNTIMDKETKKISSVKRSDLRKSSHVASAVIFDSQGNVWMKKRPPNGLLANTWDFPTISVDDLQKKTLKQSSAKKLQTMLNLSKIPVAKRLFYAGSIMHIFTHIRMQVEVFVGEGTDVQIKSEIKDNIDDDKGRILCSEGWVNRDSFSSIGVSSLARKILESSLQSKSFAGFIKAEEADGGDMSSQPVKKERSTE